MNKIMFFFPESLKKILGLASKFRYGQVTLNTGIFYLVLYAFSMKIKFFLTGTYESVINIRNGSFKEKTTITALKF